jgi:hypothetical protein
MLPKERLGPTVASNKHSARVLVGPLVHADRLHEADVHTHVAVA